MRDYLYQIFIDGLICNGYDSLELALGRLIHECGKIDTPYSSIQIINMVRGVEVIRVRKVHGLWEEI